MLVRSAREADIPAVLAIVNREIVKGFAHFGTTPSTTDDLRRWLEAGSRLPWLVAEDGGEVLGYARATPWKSRESYSWTTEIGVYVHHEARGRGVGKLLYGALFPMLDALGSRTIIAGIALPNPASVRLHELFGMTHAGTLPRVGYKLGRWIDVGYWVRNSDEEPPRSAGDQRSGA